HGHSDEGGAEQGGSDEQHDRGGAEDGQQGTEDLEAVADGRGTDGADASGDEGPQQGRGRGSQSGDEPGRGGRSIAEDRAGEDDEVGADDDVAAALEEVPGREHEHGSPAVGVEGGVGGVGGWVGRIGAVRAGAFRSWTGGGRRGGNPDGDRPGPGDEGEHGGDDRADEPQLTPVGETAGDQHDRPGDEDAEPDSAENESSVVTAAGVGRDPLGHAHEDQPRGDPGDGADAALPDEIRRQGHRGQPQGGDDEAESVDGPVGFDPAAGDDEAADEVADVVQRRDPRTRSGSPTQGRDHQRQCGSVEEP